MLSDARRDLMGSARAFPEPAHQVQECPGRRSWRWFRLYGTKFRHHLVMHRDLHTRTRVSLDSVDKAWQLLTGFADREFHHGLHVKMSETYKHVQVYVNTHQSALRAVGRRRRESQAGW
jgi:hypothetical protein